MTEDQYQDWLKKAPQDHFSEDFIQFLRGKPNKVIEETDNWLIIENIKDPNDYTAFYKGDAFGGIGKLQELVANYYPREWKIKAPHKRSVKLFHVHLIQK